MTFIFEDGTSLGVEASESHNFIKHDLDWTVQAHGKLIDISYGRGSTDKMRLISGRVMTALEAPIRRCSSLVQRLLSFIGRRAAPSAFKKCSGDAVTAVSRQDSAA